MRELEFLPTWYPQWHRRRRMVLLQVWITILLVLGLGSWLYLADRNCRDAQEVLVSLRGQLKETDEQLQQMDRLEALRKQLRLQDEVLNKLGDHIESSRLMGKLAAVLPPNVSLLNLTLEHEETPVPISNIARAALKNPSQVPMDRRLKIKVLGVAPTDVELATFITELNKVSFFERVAPTYTRDRKESGHLLREFELTFSVNLNGLTGS
jgi:Tfp pilus assembly protein PilN